MIIKNKIQEIRLLNKRCVRTATECLKKHQDMSLTYHDWGRGAAPPLCFFLNNFKTSSFFSTS